MKERLLQEMENYFGWDEKRKDHARRVLGYAEQMLKKEGGDREVVVAAAILHDIGIHVAEKKHGSPAGKYQEIEGPPIAKGILSKLRFPVDKIDEVLKIIAHHHSGGIETINFKIIWDADWLVNIPDEVGLADKEKLKNILEKVFSTKTGKELAEKSYL
ncbi:MAG: HD domain-containing protein [Candidatus Margulisiibacteriota bacterium]